MGNTKKKPAAKQAAKSRTARTTKTKKTTKPTQPAASPPAGSEDAYNKHLADAEALAASVVVPFKGDADVVHTNVLRGVESVMAKKATIAKDLPNEDLSRIAALPELSLGFIFATLLAQPGSTRDPALQADIKEAHQLRRVLLTSADALVLAGIFSEAAVAKIRSGRGSLDAAKDLIELAALFRNKATAIQGKTAVTAAQIARASALGTQLQGQITPTNAPAKKGKAATGSSPADVRNRFWTLIVEARDRLWRVGAYLFGEAGVAEKIPALLAHDGRRSTKTRAAIAQRAATKATQRAQKAAARAASVKTKGKQATNATPAPAPAP